MQGPFAPGTVGSSITPSADSWEAQHGLIRGRRYSVIKRFSDNDGDIHMAGEEWQFMSALFSKFDNEVTVCVRLDDGKDWMIPLVWMENKQSDIIENIQEYIRFE